MSSRKKSKKKATTRKRSSKKKTSTRSRSRKKTSTRKKKPAPKLKKKASYARVPYSAGEDKYIARLYEQGYEIERIADMVSRKFGTDRTMATVQGRLSRLRRDGHVEPRKRGKKGQEVRRRSANGQVEYDQTRRLAADLGERGKVEVQVSGPVVLDSEFMEDLSQSLGKLVSAS